MKNKKIGVIGADRRLSVVGDRLAGCGYEVCLFGGINSENQKNISSLRACCEGAGALILPLPYSRDGRWLNCPGGKSAVSVKAVIDEARSGCIIFGGCFDDAFFEKAADGKIKAVDYYDSERVQILNALPTCEGAICEAISATEKTLAFSEVFVCGYGRIGSLLSEKLSLLGARVNVASLNEKSLAKARIRGFDICPLDRLKTRISEADIIFNTVPHKIISHDEAVKIKPECVYIELASAPGGIDKAYAEEKGIKIISAQGLPSKYAPVSAGEIIADFIKEKIKEEER